MSYQTEIEGMEKKGIETVEHDYVTCYECGSYEDCDCDGYNQALQDVLPVIERAVAAERERAALIVEEMMEDEEHWKPITNRILDNTPPNKV